MVISYFNSSNRPNQDLSLVHDHLTDKLTGYNSPKLNLVAFDATQEISAAFANMANALKGHFHDYNSFNTKSSDSSCEHKVNLCGNITMCMHKKELDSSNISDLFCARH